MYLIFIFPGIFLWLLLMYFRKKEQRSMGIVYSGAVFLMASIFLHYYLFHRSTGVEALSDSLRNYFIAEGAGISGTIMFFGQGLFDMIVDAFSNELSLAVPLYVQNTLNGFMTIMFICGIANLFFSKRFHILFLLGLPIVVMFVFTMFGLWPFGNYRSNLFIIPNLIFLTMFGFELLLVIKKWKVDVMTKSLMVGLFMIIQFPFDFHFFNKPQIPSGNFYGNVENMPAILGYINEFVAKQPPPPLENGEKHLIVLNANGGQAFTYFTEFHSKNKHDFEAIRTRFEVLRFKTRERTQMIQQMKKIISHYPKREIWFVLYHFYKEVPVLKEIFEKFVTIKTYKLIPENWAGGSGVIRTSVRVVK